MEFATRPGIKGHTPLVCKALAGCGTGLSRVLLLFSWLLSVGPVWAQQALDTSVPALGASDSTYQLDSGDQIKINVFNQPDLSGDFKLDNEGRIFMPLVGLVDAKGRTAAELEALLVSRFKPDYLVNPRIFIQVVNYRPYYLIGEALKTGAFPYIAGMTYLTAIANAGGFTYRAKKDYVYVIRADDPEQEEVKLSVEETVQPGDIIRIAERLF
jgi:polysaccharide export outer membrane protein